MIDTNHTFLFIGGLHRSGTTLLQRCISSHPKVSGFCDTGVPEDEGQYLQKVYQPDRSFGGPGFFGFDPNSYLDESSDLATRRNAKKLFADWSEHWDLTKPVLAEKSPPNLVRARFLQALFPKSRFIMIIRHPIAVSCATQKWTNLLSYLAQQTSGRGLPPWFRSRLPTLRIPLWILIKHWILTHEKLNKDTTHINNILTVRYENLTKDPKLTLEKVWSFLNLGTFEPSEEIICGINQKYFERWRHLKTRGGLAGHFYSEYVIPEYKDKINMLGYSLNP